MDKVVIKSGKKDGISVKLSKDISFDELKEAFREKFKSVSSFFGKANMAVSFEDRKLNKEEEKELVDIISEVTDINVICIISSDEEENKVFENAVKKAIDSMREKEKEKEELLKEGELVKDVDTTSSCVFYKGTLRSGQVLESGSSAVILGDVNPGARVVANGNVIVLGSLRGNIYAGIEGNEDSFVVALEMNPMQVKIGDIIARSSDTAESKKSIKDKNKSKIIQPKIAYIYDGNIYIEELTQDVLADINI